MERPQTCAREARWLPCRAELDERILRRLEVGVGPTYTIHGSGLDTYQYRESLEIKLGRARKAMPCCGSATGVPPSRSFLS